MQPYIDDIIDVEGDGYCGYRVVPLHEGGNQEDYDLVELNMTREIKLHRKLYEKVFADKELVNYIINVLVQSGKSTKRGVAPLDKWLTFPDMGHVVTTYYNRVVVELTSPINGVSETFFPLRSSPPKDPSSQLLVIGLIPNHFVYVKLKSDAPIPKTSETWMQYFLIRL
jgi:histone-lysine N-methyltransferase SETD2